MAPNDTNGASDVFLADRSTGAVSLISATLGGMPGNASSFVGPKGVSASGRYVAFWSDAGDLTGHVVAGGFTPDPWLNVYLRDTLTGVTTFVAPAPGTEGSGLEAPNASISADGRFVAFISDADSLVANDTNGGDDVFVRDRLSGVTLRESVSTSGQEADLGVDDDTPPDITPDGRFVSFASRSCTLAPGTAFIQNEVYVRRRGDPASAPSGPTLLRCSDMQGESAGISAKGVAPGTLRATPTRLPTRGPSPSPSPSPSLTPQPTGTTTPSLTASPAFTAAPSPMGTVPVVASPTGTATVAPTPVTATTATITATVTATPMVTVTPTTTTETTTPTVAATVTLTTTPTVTATTGPPATASGTATMTATTTPTRTATPSPTLPSATPTRTTTATVTATP